MASVIDEYRDFMDTPETVARGILDQLDAERVVLFPTAKPEQAYERFRDV